MGSFESISVTPPHDGEKQQGETASALPSSETCQLGIRPLAHGFILSRTSEGFQCAVGMAWEGMPRKLPKSDFRARRVVLTRGDFGLAPKAASRRSDLIGKATWASIVRLPDDVAIRTSNHHGTALRQLDDLWGAWIDACAESKGRFSAAMLDAADEFQSATFAALTGFYRLSATALRSALEVTTVATWLCVSHRGSDFRAWRRGKAVFSFGQACDGLIAPTALLRGHLRLTVNDSLFDQKTLAAEGGFARRIYDGLSDFSHARPRNTDSQMRAGSNGPIYVKPAFRHVSWMQFEAMGLCFVLFLICRPRAKLSPAVLDLFSDAKRLRSRVTRAAFETLRRQRP